jgi:tRNA-dihydrouridine synthase B
MNLREEYERFGLTLNGRVVRTPVAIASMAGMVDADYVLARASHIGAAFIGGYSIDRRTMDAAHDLSAQGRTEFLYEDPVAELDRQIDKMNGSDVVLGLNLRGSTPASYALIAESFGDSVLYEIDAHCRQQPMIDAGCGEHLLHNPPELEEIIRTLKQMDVQVSVKMRAGVSADDRLLTRKCWRAGADIIHIDLMDSGPAKLRQIRNSSPVMLIANNGIHTFERMKEMLSHGADLVSLARRSDERTLAGLDAAITRYSDEHGWYNSPKQLCRGGDIRSLAFCCMPVKSCPLIPTLDKIGMSREEYIQLKQESVRGSPLEGGKQTCFGSLAWCCKDSSPCMFRDMTIRQTGMTIKEYMHLKHQLSERIMHHIFYDSPSDDAC